MANIAKPKNAPDDELVPHTSFFDGEKYAGAVFVGVNGKNIMIQRGVEVMIPKSFKEVLNNADAQTNSSNEHMMELQRQYAQGVSDKAF